MCIRDRRTASDERDSHPRWCSFPRGLHLRLRWLRFSRLQFKAEGPNFNAELIPVHSPLLRESCLVSYPPLTYMLKFSGFADLTSCLGGRAAKASPKDPEGHKHTACTTNSSPKGVQKVARRGVPKYYEHQTPGLPKAAGTLMHRHAHS